MSIGLLFNSIKSFIYGLTAGVAIYDHKHFPNYLIYIDKEFSVTTQLYVEDIQLDVKYIRNANGAILGYIGDDGLIDKTNYVGHVTLEGSILIWTADFDPYGIALICIPFNTQVNHLLVDGQQLEVVPMPESAQNFSTTKTRWQGTSAPGHWFTESPRTGIEVKWNRSDRYPYCEHAYYLRNVSRYDDKWYLPKYVANGQTIEGFRSTPPQVTAAEFSHALEQACFYISMIKNKNEHEPLTLSTFRKPY